MSTSTRTYTGSLADRVYAQFEDAPMGYLGVHEAAGQFSPLDRTYSDDEYDLRDWGLFYGVAYGIARGEDPYEHSDSVARRALDAARSAYDRYRGITSKVEEG